MVLGLTSFLVQAWMWFASLFDNMMVGLDNAAGYVDELTAAYLQTNSTDVDSKFIQEEPKLIRWGCLRWTQGRRKPVVPARNDYIASENYFLKLDVGPLQGHWLLDRVRMFFVFYCRTDREPCPEPIEMSKSWPKMAKPMAGTDRGVSPSSLEPAPSA